MIRALADSYRAELVRAGSAWTSTGKSHEPAGLKHRPDGAIRVVPIPPVLVSMLCRHLGDHGTTPDGRLFRGARGGMLSESVYGRAWHAARRAALGPDLAATALARRPYDLRHAALSLWLNATGAPAEVAARAGHSARVLHEVYLHCTDVASASLRNRLRAALAGHTVHHLRHGRRADEVARAAQLGPNRTADLARWRQRVGVLEYDEAVAEKWGQPLAPARCACTNPAAAPGHRTVAAVSPLGSGSVRWPGRTRADGFKLTSLSPSDSRAARTAWRGVRFAWPGMRNPRSMTCLTPPEPVP